MSPAQWEKVKEVFDLAVDLPLSERHAVLDSACREDAELRTEVNRLLAEYDRAGDFIETPAFELRQSLEVGEVVNERYDVIRLIGRGGMGEVYEARDLNLGEPIALKTLRPEYALNEPMLERFRKEILAARKVTHPNVCRVFEVGVHREAVHYFTMELIAGETLAARIKREGRLDSSTAIPIIRQMALGLHTAHQAGIVHRDFKSANVMLTGDRAVIMDFGLARLGHAIPRGGETTGSIGQIAGTVGYMSPEQLAGEKVSAASDIYSFGIVLFEMATGRLPFDGHHIINAAIQRANGQIPWTRKEAPGIDRRWETAIRKCLEPEPGNRFASAAAIADQFTSWRMPAMPWRRWPVSAAAALALVATAAVSLWPRPYEPKAEAVSWHQKGVESVLALTYESGRKTLGKAVELDPAYPLSRAYLAAALYELENQSGAKDEMLKALTASAKLRLAPEDSLRLQALQHMITREFEAARPPLVKLVAGARTNRDRAAAHVHLAWLDLKRQNGDAAKASLEEAIRLDPSRAAARLRMAVLYSIRQDVDRAAPFFAEAERLFQTASDWEGVTEVLWLQSRLLARAGRSADALKLIDRGLAIASNTGNSFHEIRLDLVKALVYQGTGEVARAKETAERAVRIAMDRKMDDTAATGLLDVGNASLVRGEPGPAEKYFQQGLEAARKGRADFVEARATSALASLYLQQGRHAEALAKIGSSVPFYRDGAYRRETVQALLVMGGAQRGLARYDDAERSLREAVRRAEELRDREHLGMAYMSLAGLNHETGRLPEAAADATRALELLGDIRGGYRAVHGLASRAQIWVQLGRFDRAAEDVAESSRRAATMPGDHTQAKARLALVEAETAYVHGKWAKAAEFARKAQGLRGGLEEDWQAALWIALCAARAGNTTIRSLAETLEASGSEYLAARGRLLFAEATGNVTEAQRALRFFEPRRNWEAVWRCRRAMGGAEHDLASRAAIDELRREWPPESHAPYFGRPDFKGLKLL